MTKSIESRKFILDKVAEFYDEAFPKKNFIAGETPIAVSGRVFTAEDLTNLVDSSLDFWLTTGRYAEQFEKEFQKYLNVRFALLCNSGSSANLLAVSALTSLELDDRALKPGDEVITLAAGFPTTVAPIIQNHLKPVFVDIDEKTHNVDIHQLKKAIGKKTKAMIFAHTLGNPFNIKEVLEIKNSHNLWLIEDNCDALGSTYQGSLTGSFGDIATFSFYPAHHITMGEGGCVVTNDPKLKKIIASFRDWGRDCWCNPGKDNTCGKRFKWQAHKLPYGYDHKYIYSHLGYNLKLTDMQAAVGLSQLKKLDQFIKVRKRNWNLLYQGLKDLAPFFILPEATQNSDPSWFGFLLTIQPNAAFCREDMISYLENKKIATRLLFGGNLTKQPAFKNVDYKISGDLKNTDLIMDQAFWIGVYPGITEDMIKYMVQTIHDFINQLPNTKKTIVNHAKN